MNSLRDDVFDINGADGDIIVQFLNTYGNRGHSMYPSSMFHFKQNCIFRHDWKTRKYSDSGVRSQEKIKINKKSENKTEKPNLETEG